MEMVGGGAPARYHRHNNSAEAESGTGKNMCTSLSWARMDGQWALGTMGSDMWHEDIGDTMESHRDPGQWPSLQCCSAAAAQQQRRHSAVHCTVVYILSGWLLLVPFVSTGFESTRFIFVYCLKICPTGSAISIQIIYSI